MIRDSVSRMRPLRDKDRSENGPIPRPVMRQSFGLWRQTRQITGKLLSQRRIQHLIFGKLENLEIDR